MPSFKVAILEKDGEEFGYVKEYDPEIMLPELGFLKDGLTASAGWSCIIVDEEIELKSRRVAVCSKFIKHAGFIKHTGFVKRST